MPSQLKPDDSQHTGLRDLLRVIGPVIVIVGGIFTLIGLVSFFSAFGGMEPPRQFWCAFVGLLLVGIGMAISKFAYLGAITRYMADEVAPVGSDVVNYMTQGTKESVRDLATAVGEGFRTGSATGETRVVRCRKCNTDNDAAARFCKNCGTSLAKTKPCEACGEMNDLDARFCDNCGKALV